MPPTQLAGSFTRYSAGNNLSSHLSTISKPRALQLLKASTGRSWRTEKKTLFPQKICAVSLFSNEDDEIPGIGRRAEGNSMLQNVCIASTFGICIQLAAAAMTPSLKQLATPSLAALWAEVHAHPIAAALWLLILAEFVRIQQPVMKGLSMAAGWKAGAALIAFYLQMDPAVRSTALLFGGVVGLPICYLLFVNIRNFLWT